MMTEQERLEASIGVGVDLGGTYIKIGAINAAGDILADRSIPTRSYEGPERVLERLGGAAREVIDEIGRPPKGVGIGIPGLLDIRNGITKFMPNFEGHWRDIPVRAIVEPLVGCPVHILNDVRTATVGELHFGHGRDGVKTMVFLALGTGIGGGVVIDGKLRLGPLGAAGELGHITVYPEGGRPCGCGNRGCLEAYASGPALSAEGVRLLRSGQAPILNRVVAGDPGKVDPKTMAEAAMADDQAVRRAIIRAAEFLAIGLANVVVTLHPELIVLGGGVAGIGDLLFSTVRKRVRKRVQMFPVDDLRILPSALGDRAGLLGAGALALKEGQV